MSKSNPKVGFVSLGCPKALVDSERILTQLRADGYALSGDYTGADVVIVNTCGFLDSAKAESAWAALNKRFGFLSGVNRKIAEAKVEGGRAVFRLQAITSNSSEAQQLCAKLRVAGENCLIVR